MSESEKNNIYVSDEELIGKFIAERSEEAFRKIVERYSGLVYGICLRALHDHYRAEEAVQTVFIILSKRAEAIQKRRALGWWLFSTSRNVVMNMEAKEKRRIKHERKAGLMIKERNEQMEEADSIWEHAEPYIDRIIEKLPRRIRTPFVMYYLGRRTQAEIAFQMGCDIKTVRKRVRTGLAFIKKRLGRYDVAVPSVGVLSMSLAEHASPPPGAELIQSLRCLGTASEGAEISSALAAVKGGSSVLSKILLTFTAGAAVCGIAAGAFFMINKFQNGKAVSPQPAETEEHREYLEIEHKDIATYGGRWSVTKTPEGLRVIQSDPDTEKNCYLYFPGPIMKQGIFTGRVRIKSQKRNTDGDDPYQLGFCFHYPLTPITNRNCDIYLLRIPPGVWFDFEVKFDVHTDSNTLVLHYRFKDTEGNTLPAGNKWERRDLDRVDNYVRKRVNCGIGLATESGYIVEWENLRLHNR